MEEDCWKAETKFLEREGIRHLLGAPHIAYLGHWKEEEKKFTIIRYHEGYIWLKKLIAFKGGLIHRITDIPKEMVNVPKTTNVNDWMQFLTCTTMTKNSKGLIINKIPNLHARWTAIIISLCFTPIG